MSIVKTIEVEIKAGKAEKDLKGIQKGLKGVETQTDKTKESTEELTGKLDGITGGAVGKFKAFRKSLGGVTKGFKSLKFAIMASGIGALALGILAVVQAFKSSEAGQNKFAKIMAVIGSVTGNLTDLLSDLGEGIISVFEDPKQAVIDLKNLIVKNITNRITSLIDTFGFLGSAIKKVFSRDFSGALEDAKSAGSSYVDTLTGVKGTIDKVTESVTKMSSEFNKDAKLAGEIADQKAKADKLERALIVDRAKANRERAKLLEQAIDKENFSTAERIKFLEEAAALEEKITNQEIAAAKIRSEAKTLENSLSKSTKEDLVEEEQLKANLINLETARLTKQKLVTSQISALKSQEAAAAKAIKDQEKKDKVDADKVLADAKTTADAQKEKDRLQGIEDHELELKQKEEIRQANLSNLDTIIAVAGQETKIGRALFIAKQAMLVKEQIAKAKATLTEITLKGVAAGVDASAGFMKTAAAGFPQNVPLLIAFGAQVAGIFGTIKSASNAAKGAASKMGGSGGGSVSSPRISASAASIPPAFNVVGASETNQLAQSIGQDEKQPIKAFVVSNDVSDAQSLDRNIIESASIG